MRLVAMIERLQELHKEHGDWDVYLDVDANGLIEIGEIGVDTDDTGIIIWREDRDEEADGRR
ncbi:MAG: hypothetical protein JZU65_12945 [Chlorobium sp.]|nr:hypothetical protein [Chlorobium sp.]